MPRFVAALVFYGAAQMLAQSVPQRNSTDEQPVLVAPHSHAGTLQVIAVHPTEPWFVTAADDGEIHVRRLPDAALLRALKTASIESAAPHLASSRVATCGVDAVIRVWDLRTGKMRVSAKLNSHAAPALAWSPDGSRIAVRFWDKLTLLRADTLTIEKELPPLTGQPHALAFLNNTTLIASGYGDYSNPREYQKVIEVWSIEDAHEVARFVVDGLVNRIVPAGGDNVLLLVSEFGAEKVEVWATNPARRIASELIPNAGSVTLAPDGKRVYVTVADAGLHVREFPSLRQLEPPHRNVLGASVSAISPKGDVFIRENSGGVELFTVPKLELMREIYGRNQGAGTVIHAMEFNPGGELEVVTSAFPTSELWEFHSDIRKRSLRDNQILRILPGGERAIVVSQAGINLSDVKSLKSEISGKWPDPETSHRFVSSADGQTLASCTSICASGAEVLVWRLSDARVLQRVPIQVSATFALSPDGATLAVGGAYHDVTLYPVGREGREIRFEISKPPEGIARPQNPVNQVVFSPDGKTIATGTRDGVVRLWNAVDGRLVRAFDAHPGSVSAISFQPGGALLASGSRTGDLRVWEIDSGRVAAAFLDLGSAPQFIAWRPERTIVAVAGADCGIRVLDWTRRDVPATAIFYRDPDQGTVFVATTPDGLFEGSEEAWEEVFWEFGGETFNYQPAGMYFVDYFYPGLFQKILDGESPAAPAQLQRRDRRQPVLALETAADYKPNTFEASVRITIEAKDGVQVRDVRLFRNHVLAHEWPGELRSVDGKLVLDAKIPLGTGRNVITVYAFNQDGIRSKQESMLLRAPVITPQPGRTVYVLAAGVNVYRDPAIAKLNYAASDAKLVTERIGGQGMRLALIAARIHPVLLTDAEATRERILTELRAIASAAKPFDAVLIYFSGHGMSDGERYHLLPHDALLSGDAAALKPVPNTTVSDADLAEALRPLQAGIAALVIDSCESGRALEASDDRRRGPINAHGFAQLAYEKGIQILAASQNGRSALELSELEQGLLTYALIKEGIGKALALRTPGEDDLALGEWFAYAADRVPELHAEKTGAPRSITMLGTNPTGGRQRPQLYVRKNLDAKLWLRVDQ